MKTVWKRGGKVVRFNCVDLMLAEQWDTGKCCLFCHCGSGIEETVGPKIGFPKDMRGRLCCAALARCLDIQNPVEWDAVRRAVVHRKMMEGREEKITYFEEQPATMTEGMWRRIQERLNREGGNDKQGEN